MKTTKLKPTKLKPAIASPTWGDVQRMAENILKKLQELVPAKRGDSVLGGGSPGGAVDVLYGQDFYTLAFLSSLMVDGKLNDAKLIPDKTEKKPSKKLAYRRALVDLLDMLEEWNGGFDGFAAVNQAERLLGRPVSDQPQPRGLMRRPNKPRKNKKHSRSGQVRCDVCSPLRCKLAKGA